MTYKPLTPQDVIDDFFEEFGELLNHAESCLGVSERERIGKFLREAIERKDDEAVLAVEIVLRNMEEKT